MVRAARVEVPEYDGHHVLKGSQGFHGLVQALMLRAGNCRGYEHWHFY